MPLLLFFLVLSFIYPSYSQSNVTLSYSSLASKVINPVNAPAVQKAMYPYPSKISQIPQAQWIWAGYGNTSDCPMTITVEDQVKITCLVQPVTLYAAADNSFNATFLGSTLSGDAWNAPVSLSINPKARSCNGTYKFTITASNQKYENKTGCEGGNWAALIYGVIQKSPSVCCEDDTSYYNATTCQCYPCSERFSGCSKCTIDSCTLCNTAGNFIPSGTGCKCKSDQFALNNQLCVRCNTLMTNCTNCMSSSICTQCSTGSTLNPVTNLCIPCGIGCLSCNYTQCFICDISKGFSLSNKQCKCNQTSFVLGTQCKLCSAAITNCTKCDNNTHCNQCKKSTMINNLHICEPCKIGCLDCDFLGGCITCDSLNHFQIQLISMYNECLCEYSYALNSFACQLCNLTLSDCLDCSSISSCLQCRPGTMLIPLQTCQVCKIGCLTCDYVLGCLSCDIGYYLQFADCRAKCGDGLFVPIQGEECDDGNIINGDGCSQHCIIQFNYTCTSVINGVSDCSFNSYFRMFVKWVKKQYLKNQLTIVIGIRPNISSLNKLNFSAAISMNNSLRLTYNQYFQNGTLLLKYNFTRTEQGKNCSLNFDSRTASKLFYATLPSTLIIEMTTNQNIPIVNYKSQQYHSSEIIQKITLILIVISKALIIIGAPCNKVIGLQVILTWQVAFFSLSNIDKVQPLLSTIFPMAAVNGYNWNTVQDNRCVPDRVNAIKYSNNISDNLNFMLLVLFLVGTFLPLVIHLLSKVVPKYKQKILNISSYVRSQYMLVITLYQIMNIGYASGIQLLYGQTNALNYSLVFFGLFFGTVTFLELMWSNGVFYRQITNFMKPNHQSQSYFKINIFYRFFLGFIMSVFNQSRYVVVYSLFFSAFFLTYQLSTLPFINSYHNYHSILCQISTVIILGIRMFYRSMKYNYPIQQVSKILMPTFIEIGLITLCVLFGWGCLIYDMSKKYCSCKKSIKKPRTYYPELTKQNLTMEYISHEKPAFYLEQDNQNTMPNF